MSYLSPTLNLLVSAAKKAGQSLTRDFNEVERLQNSVKGSADFTASAISRCDRILRQELSRAKPTYAFAADGQSLPQGMHFVISALDGVTNFAHAVPHFAISIALVDNTTPLMAVVYNPVADEMYFAEKGTGASKEGFRNHERLRVSGRKDFSTSLVAIASGYRQEPAEELALQSRVMAKNENVRLFGALSLDLAYVAAGRLDAALCLSAPASASIAGLLLVKEAGGMVREMHQQDVRVDKISDLITGGDIFAANANLGTTVYNLLND